MAGLVLLRTRVTQIQKTGVFGLAMPNQSNRTKIKYKYNNNNKYNRLVRLLIGTQLLDFTIIYIVPDFLHPLHCHVILP